MSDERTAAGGRLKDRIALVTGASRGIGAAVARRFAAEGARLVLVARTVGGLEETDDACREAGGQGATLVPFDLREFDKIDHLGAQLFERFGRLDVLVGNAAVLGVLSPVGHLQPDVWQQVMDINVTANWRLIRSLDPLLRQSPAGRAIFVTSGVTAGVFAYWSAYAASKAALETLARTYAAEVTKTNVRVNLLDPGVVRTRMRAQAFPGENPLDLPPPEAVTSHFVDLAAADCQRHGETLRAYQDGT
jgi:NAD(P)-dependent dehydrogenase (short-subunit alcohol dehydrogenase family)